MFPTDIFVSAATYLLKQKGITVLDFGCGTGELTSEFLRQGFRTYGCDLVPEKITKAKELLHERGQPEGQIVHLEVLRNEYTLKDKFLLPYSDSFFDVIVAEQ